VPNLPARSVPIPSASSDQVSVGSESPLVLLPEYQQCTFPQGSWATSPDSPAPRFIAGTLSGGCAGAKYCCLPDLTCALPVNLAAPGMWHLTALRGSVPTLSAPVFRTAHCVALLPSVSHGAPVRACPAIRRWGARCFPEPSVNRCPCGDPVTAVVALSSGGDNAVRERC